tara:strand:- start:1430 stop:1783 length:354 start_codon:yes stop_codon:yes gene_type:complete
MKIPLKIEKIGDDFDCFEDVVKVIRYKITNNNRHIVRDITVTGQTINEDGERTRSNFCKEIKGVETSCLPNEYFEISASVKLNKEFNETIEIDGKQELSAIDLDIKVTGTLYISKVK